MDHRFSSIPTVILAASIIALALYGSLSARNDDRPVQKTPDTDRLEDAIIIEGLQMDSENPPEDEGDEINGMILYDDDFMPAKDAAQTRPAKKENTVSSESVLKELKEKDPRWHTTGYTIKRGDNLWSIAKKFGTDHRSIIGINEIKNPESLKPGRKILVPSRIGVYYTVREGDTLSGIAARYRTKMARIQTHNGITTLLRPGMKLFLPGATAPVSPPKAVRGDSAAVAGAPRGDTERARMTFSWPARGRITSSFGHRRDPFTKKRKFHCGIDISLDPGTPIHAAADGTVIFSGWKDGYGNMVVVKHENGYITVYAHNRSNEVREGEAVRLGQRIALSGMTGLVTGAHLHFEVRKYLTPLNPMRMLR